MARSLDDGRERGMSVVIPAHNEAAVLPHSLRAAIEQDFDGAVDIVVVANGCHDRTAEVARSFITAANARGRSLRVYELQLAGKPDALNKGDAVKRFECTMYVDADVVLSSNALTKVYRALNGPDPILLASPNLEIAASGSAVTRAYGRVWSRVPYLTKRVRGVGCYALSEEGRARWGAYPDLISDDRFVRLHFDAHEQRVVDGANYTWPLPEGLRELVRVRARWLFGNNELRRARPDLVQRDDPRYEGLVGFVVRSPTLWPYVAVFVAVYGLALVRMWLKQRRGDRTWDRALRSRDLHRSTTLAPSVSQAVVVGDR